MVIVLCPMTGFFNKLFFEGSRFEMFGTYGIKKKACMIKFKCGLCTVNVVK